MKNLIVIKLDYSRINLPHRRGGSNRGLMSVSWAGRRSAGSLKMRRGECTHERRLAPAVTFGIVYTEKSRIRNQRLNSLLNAEA